jgi:uncharacterized protein (TIGR03083 family)
MEIAEHIAVLHDSGTGLARAAGAAGLDAAVPHCPEWQVRDLLRHTGGVHRWAASYVTTGRAGPTTEEEDAVYFDAGADGDLLDWFGAGHAALVSALQAAPPDLECWTFLAGVRSPLAFWARRQAHETTVHRVDAEAAAGQASAVAPEVAADGIDELFNGFFARPGGRLFADPAVSLGVQATDSPAAWTIHIRPDGRTISEGVAGADCTIAGPARSLYLLLWNRLDPSAATNEGVVIRGRGEVYDLWRRQARVVWS